MKPIPTLSQCIADRERDLAPKAVTLLFAVARRTGYAVFDKLIDQIDFCLLWAPDAWCGPGDAFRKDYPHI